MKLSLVCIPLIMAAALVAQPPAGAHDPGQRLENMLTRSLGLSAAQQNQVHTILADAAVQSQGSAEQLKGLRKNLIDAIKANNTALIDSLTLQISQLQQPVEAIRSKAAAQIYAILTTDQQTKIGNGIGMLLGGRFGPGPGMRHGGPPKQ